jgi:hypothetical protein
MGSSNSVEEEFDIERQELHKVLLLCRALVKQLIARQAISQTIEQIAEFLEDVLVENELLFTV